MMITAHDDDDDDDDEKSELFVSNFREKWKFIIILVLLKVLLKVLLILSNY